MQKVLVDRIVGFWENSASSKCTIYFKDRRPGLTTGIAKAALELVQKPNPKYISDHEQSECICASVLCISQRKATSLIELVHKLSKHSEFVHVNITAAPYYEKCLWHLNNEFSRDYPNQTKRLQQLNADVIIVNDANYVGGDLLNYLPKLCTKLILCGTGIDQEESVIYKYWTNEPEMPISIEEVD